MINKKILFASLLIIAFDVFVLSKAMHPVKSESYINYFIKKKISRDEYWLQEMNGLGEGNGWRLKSVCKPDYYTTDC